MNMRRSCSRTRRRRLVAPPALRSQPRTRRAESPASGRLPPRTLSDEEANVTTTEALQAWGAYDRDDPFSLFGDIRHLGPVHHVTLVDGHDAWLVVRYEEA